MEHVDPERFDELVAQALDGVPEELARHFDNVVVLVEDEPPEEGLLGLFEGTPLPERDSGWAGSLPDTVRLFRAPLVALAATEDELREEVWVTVVHELAHHVGIDDDRLEELGWA